MILSVSRRTDIPSFYSDWFFDRLKEGEVLVPNPFIKDGKIARIKLEPVRVEKNLLGLAEVTGTIEGIVFWTKNPEPMLAKMNELKKYACYFQYTLNPYNKLYESNLPPLENRIDTFIKLSKFCPIVWRYDPIFLSKTVTVDWHLKQFESMAKQLQGSTTRCMINTLIGKYKDAYCPGITETKQIAKGFADIGKQYGIEIYACAEIIDLQQVGISKGKCIDPELFEKLLSAKVKSKKISPTRKGCGCMPSIDIGAYSTCQNGCIYCYADKGALKSLKDKPTGEIYDRKVELVFDYS